MDRSQEFKPLIIIPSYNTRQHLPGILSRINVLNYDCLVVNDGSTDGLQANDVSHGHYIAHANNMGKGAALKTGLNWASVNGYSHAVSLDADGQHPPDSLPAFEEMAEQCPRSFILARRRWKVGNMPFHRILSNTITSMILSLRAGQRIFDSQVGFRVYPLYEPALWVIDEQGFQFESAVLLRAARMRYHFAHVPIPVIYAGEASQMDLLADTIRFVRLIFRSFMC